MSGKFLLTTPLPNPEQSSNPLSSLSHTVLSLMDKQQTPHYKGDGKGQGVISFKNMEYASPTHSQDFPLLPF